MILKPTNAHKFVLYVLYTAYTLREVHYKEYIRPNVPEVNGTNA
jgi:hypothetical protein